MVAEWSSPGGHSTFTLTQLLAPPDATARLIGVGLAEPLVLHGARTVSDENLAVHATRYREPWSSALRIGTRVSPRLVPWGSHAAWMSSARPKSSAHPDGS